MSSAHEGSAADKPYDATPGRLDKARRDGDIALSREAITAATYTGLLIALIWAGRIATDVVVELRGLVIHPSDIAATAFNGGENAAWAISWRIAGDVAIIFALPAGCAFVAVLAQKALVFAPGKLKPKISRLSVISNAKKKFGPDGLAEFLRTLGKLVFILFLISIVFLPRFENLPTTVGAPPSVILRLLRSETLWLLGPVTLFAFIVAVIDLPLTHQAWRKRLRMSHDEVRRDNRETEGDPHMRQSRRDRATAIATNRMLSDVPTASVVIVNPTHFAVALKWSPSDKSAPVCIAKGADELAHRIIERASENKVPIRRDAPTARALFATIEVGGEIERTHFAAVAAAIHFAEKMRQSR